MSPASSELLSALGVDALPDYCEGLCTRCLWDVAPWEEPLTEEMVMAYLARKTNQIAARVAAGMVIVRCEVMRIGWYSEPIQCSFFGHHELPDGHRVCSHCMKRGQKEELHFVGEDYTPPRLIQFYAVSSDDLLAKAAEEARRWRWR